MTEKDCGLADTEKCTSTGCTDTCTAYCSERGSCSHRKHFKTGGVCCISCHTSCDRCGVAIYWEDSKMIPPGAVVGWPRWWAGDDDFDCEPDDESRLCHCCAIEVSPSPSTPENVDSLSE